MGSKIENRCYKIVIISSIPQWWRGLHDLDKVESVRHQPLERQPV